MNKMPTDLRAKLDKDPWYHRCTVTGATLGKIEWHHNFIFAGKQVQEEWCILPLAQKVHDRANRKDVREVLDWIMLNRTDDATLLRYGKATDLIGRRDHLNRKFGGAWRKGRYTDLVL